MLHNYLLAVVSKHLDEHTMKVWYAFNMHYAHGINRTVYAKKQNEVQMHSKMFYIC